METFIDVLSCLRETWGLTGHLADFLAAHGQAARSALAVPKPR